MVSTLGKQHTYRISGTVSYGSIDSLGFASIAAWDVETAQSLLNREGRYDGISVAAKEGTSAAQLVQAIKPVLPAGLQVEDSAAQAKKDANEVNDGMAMIRWVLLGFGAIALLVGGFVIFNTLSITVAQRTREFATLRTLGASRKQVMRSVRLEGLVIGLLASVIGLVSGLAIAKGMVALFSALGVELPDGGTVIAPAHDHDLADHRHRGHAAREHPAGAARDPRAADRGRPRGRRTPGHAVLERTRRRREPVC